MYLSAYVYIYIYIYIYCYEPECCRNGIFHANVQNMQHFGTKNLPKMRSKIKLFRL